MPIQDDMEQENRFTLNTIMSYANIIRTYQNQPLEPFPMNHIKKCETANLKFDEGHYLFEALKAMKKAKECYVERYQIHQDFPTGEHEVIGIEAPKKWNRWSQNYGNRGREGAPTENRGRMRIFEEK